MATNLAIDDVLLEKALRTGKLKTKKDTVNLALKEFIERREQVKILELFNNVVFDEGVEFKSSHDRS